jgi:hypothetical protein
MTGNGKIARAKRLSGNIRANRRQPLSDVRGSEQALSGVLHCHGEAFAQYGQGGLDLFGFGFVRGVEHTAHDTFIDVQAA